ncbi:MAG: hypothetical protein ABFD92_18740 [Planctomycetaceae bacterium]|nr:hypothetical protein [Planctomycetaceae bacterium]
MASALIMMAMSAATTAVGVFTDGITAPLYSTFWPVLATFYTVVLLAATCAVVFRDARRTYLD